MKKSKKVSLVGGDCVACGSCMKACPKDAIAVLHGIKAFTDVSKCIGCALCSEVCPANVISMVERGSEA